MWNKKQKILQENRERREKVKRHLERQKHLAQEKLIEEQEKEELYRMEKEIHEINQRRSVEPVPVIPSKKAMVKNINKQTNVRLEHDKPMQLKVGHAGATMRNPVKQKGATMTTRAHIPDYTSVLDMMDKVQLWLNTMLDSSESSMEEVVKTENVKSV